MVDYFQDLPEVPDVDITVDENVQLVELGVVFSVVDSLGKIFSSFFFPSKFDPLECLAFNFSLHCLS